MVTAAEQRDEQIAPDYRMDQARKAIAGARAVSPVVRAFCTEPARKTAGAWKVVGTFDGPFGEISTCLVVCWAEQTALLVSGQLREEYLGAAR